MDEDGCPTEETLRRVREWDPKDFHGLAALLRDLWIYPEYVSLDGDTLRISTGGWSGHEDLLVALPVLWRTLHFWSLRRGGHYVFTRMGKPPGVRATCSIPALPVIEEDERTVDELVRRASRRRGGTDAE